MIHLIEVDAYDPAVPGVVTLRYGTHGYTTQPGDTPANAHFAPRIVQPGNYERNVWARGTTGGDVTVNVGEVVLVNPDGELDGLLDLGFDGRSIRIYSLPDPSSSWSARTTVLRGTLDQPEVTWSRVTLRIRDRLAELRVPVQPLLYAGTTVAGGMAEAEGMPDDLKGLPKPLLLGRALHIPVVAANAFDLIYQVSSNALYEVTGVYDRGVALSAAGNLSTLVGLCAASVTAGTYKTCLASGHIKLGAVPAGQITADAAEGAPGSRSAPTLVERLLTAAGMASALDTGSFTALAASASAECGIWLGPEATDVLGVASALLESVGGWLVPDRLGVLGVGRIGSATPVLTLTSADLLESGQGLQRIVTNDEGRGVPAWKVTVRYGRNLAVQSASELDQVAATAAYKALAASEWRSAVATDAAVQTAHLLAPEMSFDTAIVDEADALAEAGRRLDLYKVRRDRYLFPLRAEIAGSLELGQTVEVILPRFGLDLGKSLVVLGIEEQRDRGLTILDLWG